MSNAIDQLVFGYEEGHRLLGGSTRIPATALAVLLDATDAPLESVRDRLVTGLPMDAIGRYALAFTWSAPELPRPGAVWSHVLLVEPGCFEQQATVKLLRNLARRPEVCELERYKRPLSLGSGGGGTVGGVPLPLIEAIVAALYGDGGPVVVHEDLTESERALFAIWDAQWPQLRGRFEFRTRESARVSSSGGVVVARRLRGMMRGGKAAERTRWISLLAEAMGTQRESPLRRFLGRFGASDRPEPSTVAWLTDLYCDIRSEEYVAVRGALENRYSDQRSGRDLKEQLFGKLRVSWWNVPEALRLAAILGARRDAWDLEALDLGRRLAEWIRQHGVRQLLQESRHVGAASVREAFVISLVEAGTSSDFGWVARVDPEVARRWLVERPVVGREPEAWRGVANEEVRRLWSAVGSPDAGMVVAAVVAGHAQIAIEVVGLPKALAGAARAGDCAAATALVKASTWTEIARVSEGDIDVALLLGAVFGGGDVPGVVAALEARRDDVNETWLRAAAGAVSRRDLPAGRVLEVVFGPLHHAITDDRLPAECWELLNGVVPEAPDPALRLRRFLVRVAREEGWGHKRFWRALRGAGPYASELYREFYDDELLLGKIRNFIERL